MLPEFSAKQVTLDLLQELERAMVKLRIADALAGKPVVLIPSGRTGIGLNKLDVNKLIESTVMQTETKDDADTSSSNGNSN